MFEGSAAFRKLNKNKYLFIPGSIFSSRAYVISSDEKKQIQESLKSSMSRVIFLILPGFLLTKFNLILAVFFLVVAGGGEFLRYKIKLNRLLLGKTQKTIKPTGLLKSVKLLAIEYEERGQTGGLFGGLVSVTFFIVFFTSKYNGSSPILSFCMFAFLLVLWIGGGGILFCIMIQKIKKWKNLN